MTPRAGIDAVEPDLVEQFHHDCLGGRIMSRHRQGDTHPAAVI